MTTTIFYFSGTGNSLKVARDVAEGLGDTELVPIDWAIKNGSELSTDRIGIVSPVYAWGLPIIVCDFITGLEPAGEKYIFSVLTYGGSPAKANVQVREMLEEKGLSLSAGFAVNMPGSFILMYGAQKEEKQKELFTGESHKIREIVAGIKESTAVIETGGRFMNLFGTIMYRTQRTKFKMGDRKYIANEKCTNCGTCEKICPVDNIELSSGKPQWHHNCEQCMRCIQWCPTEAIQAGKATLTRKRYNHPEVKASDFFTG